MIATLIKRLLLGIALVPMIVLCGFTGFAAGLFFTSADNRHDAVPLFLVACLFASAAFGLLRMLVAGASARPGAAMAVLLGGCLGTGWAVGEMQEPMVAAWLILLLVPTVLGVLRAGR